MVGAATVRGAWWTRVGLSGRRGPGMVGVGPVGLGWRRGRGRRLARGGGGGLGEGKAGRPAARRLQRQSLPASGDDLRCLGAANRAVLAEGLLQIFVAERVGQVAHVKFVAHEGLLKKHKNAMEPDAINKPVSTSTQQKVRGYA